MSNLDIKLIVIDSFCGAGGVTEGFHRAEVEGKKCCKVIIGINHDSVAIASHKANHPETHHFIEDFTELDPHKLIDIVDNAKRLYPNAKVMFWMSAECTHHSKAKGGMPRDADSRSLPEHAERYVEVLNPDIIGVENVTEFLDWGALNENGKPIKEQKGVFFNKWRDGLIGYGYKYDHRILNAADFGAYTSRVRYFGIFAKDDTLISFPTPTHSKKGDLFTPKWKSVKDVLELDIEGESIFERSKPLVDATLDRILSGIERFVIKGTNDYLIKYNSMSQSKRYKAPSINEPSPTISCQGRVGVVRAKFNKPLQMLSAYYGNGYNTAITEPCGTVTTKDRFALVTSKFIDEQYGNGRAVSIESPSGTIMTTPKQSVVTAKWLLNPQYNSSGSSIEKPCFTLIARMDKAPPYLMQTKIGNELIKIIESDSDKMKLLKHLCNYYGIVDIRMRMLLIIELLRIQGFGDEYKLNGTKADMKKFIGNAVECNQAKVLAESISQKINLILNLCSNELQIA